MKEEDSKSALTDTEIETLKILANAASEYQTYFELADIASLSQPLDLPKVHLYDKDNSLDLHIIKEKKNAIME